MDGGYADSTNILILEELREIRSSLFYEKILKMKFS